jgi:16S rRNA (guanine966-N2)-methyltransferase
MSLRIVAGKHRGRTLETPEGENVRPTSARAREALFNILVHGGHGESGVSPLHGARVLDVFAGSGALGIEALSRGAAHASFLESDREAVRLIGENLRKIGEAANARIVRCDATMPPPASTPASLAFVDPPYRSGLAGKSLAAMARTGWLADQALLTLELARTEDVEMPAGFSVLDERRYGAAKILILRFSRSTAGAGG